VNHSFTGDFSASGIERALDRVPSRETTNLSASWWSEDYKTAVRFAINNVMDNDQVYSLSTTGSGDNYSKYGGALSPRTMYVDVRYRF
jgi:outer membrane receptor protein involved in Fe transport